MGLRYNDLCLHLTLTSGKLNNGKGRTRTITLSSYFWKEPFKFSGVSCPLLKMSLKYIMSPNMTKWRDRCSCWNRSVVMGLSYFELQIPKVYLVFAMHCRVYVLDTLRYAPTNKTTKSQQRSVTQSMSEWGSDIMAHACNWHLLVANEMEFNNDKGHTHTITPSSYF